MIIQLYKTFDDDNVINKTLELKHEIEINLKGNTDITNPVIPLQEIEDLNLKEVNYAYLPEFKRYYFIRNISTAPNKIYNLFLDCDVIETYKETILNSEVEITRAIGKDDYRDINPNLEVRKEVDVYESDKGLSTDKFSIVFSTIGQDLL